MPSSPSTETNTPASIITPTITERTTPIISRTITNRSDCYLSRSCLSDITSFTDQIEVSITNVSRSILDLLPSKDKSTLSTNIISLSALHISDIQDSILILGHVDGSIMLHKLTNCVVVAGCHQVEIYLCACYMVYNSTVLTTRSSGCMILRP